MSGTNDPKASIETQPRLPMVGLLQRGEPIDLDALQNTVMAKIENVVQRKDIEHLKVGDKMVSGSGTVRKIIKKNSTYSFTCETSKSYIGDRKTNHCFRLTPEQMAPNLRSSVLFELAPGTTVYGPDGEEMRIKKILCAGNDGQSNPCGIEVTFQEDIKIDPKTFGEWLEKIIKKDTTGA